VFETEEFPRGFSEHNAVRGFVRVRRVIALERLSVTLR